MYDFWFTLGSMIADPQLMVNLAAKLAEIQKGPNPFKNIGLTFSWTGSGKSGSNPAATAYSKEIDGVRESIDAAFRGRFRVPISAYCAASIAQLMLSPGPLDPRPGSSFPSIMLHLSALFGQNLAAESADLRALVGLILVDTTARTYFAANSAAAGDAARALYVSPTPTGAAILTGFATYLAQNPDWDPHNDRTWAPGCFQVLHYYPGFDNAIR